MNSRKGDDSEGPTEAAYDLVEIGTEAPDLELLARFYSLFYVAQFPDPDERESLKNMEDQLRAGRAGNPRGDCYHIVVAMRDGEPVGSVLIDYLAETNTGIIEFLSVTPSERGRRIGRALLVRAEEILEADARAAGALGLDGIVAEMNDPFVRGAPDSMDPFDRALVWAKWGFSAVLAPYVQPALSAAQRPVHGLLLIMKLPQTRRSASIDPAWLRRIVASYMRWAMRIAEPTATPEFQHLAGWLASVKEVPLVALDRYVGVRPKQDFSIERVTGPGSALDEVIALVRGAVTGPGRVASRAEFVEALQKRESGVSYHLWALRHSNVASVEGMASFYTLPEVGFGGYLVLGGELRGRGCLAPLVARMEQQMLRDRSNATGWLVECVPESAAAFRRVGFSSVPCDYRPPPVGSTGALGGSEPRERYDLLYKQFGRRPQSEPMTRDFVLAGVASVLRHVYGVTDPHRDPCWERVRGSWGVEREAI